MPTSRPRQLVSFTPEEKAEVKAKADRLGLYVSEYLRCLGLNYPVPDPADFAAAQGIRDLLKINADQARLGNLLKLALEVGEGDLSPAAIMRIDELVTAIRETQETLRNGAKSLHYEMHPRQRRKP